MADGVTDAEDRTAAPLGHTSVPPTRNQASLLRTNNNKDRSACSAGGRAGCVRLLFERRLLTSRLSFSSVEQDRVSPHTRCKNAMGCSAVS